jgi:photosystem II stability/assembly factor-like uncharacterized protein
MGALQEKIMTVKSWLMRIPSVVFAAALLVGMGPDSSPAHTETQTDIIAPAGSGQFGEQVVALEDGNTVVADPAYRGGTGIVYPQRGEIDAPMVPAGINVWTSHGPDGGRIRALAINAQNPPSLYAGGRSRIFKSVNGGENWLPTHAIHPNYGGFWGLATDPRLPNTILAGNGNSNVLTSTDGGVSWSWLLNVGGGQARALVFDPQTPTTFYAGGNGIYKCTGLGTHCEYIGPSGNVWAIAVHPLTPTTIYVGTYESYGSGLPSGLFRTTDGGRNWRQVPMAGGNPYVLSLIFDPKNPEVMYAGTQFGTLKSTDGGYHWRRVTYSAWSVVFDPQTPTTLYAGNWGGGVYKSTDDGENWNPVNQGLTNKTVYVLIADPWSPLTLYAGTDVGVFKSTNGGESWDLINGGLVSRNVVAMAVHPQMPMALYAGGEMGVFRSTDKGMHWSPSGWITESVSALAFDPQSPTTLYAASRQNAYPYDGNLIKSDDGGITWNKIDLGADYATVGPVAISPLSRTNILCATSSSTLLKSIDAGGHWSPAGLGVFTRDLWDIEFDPHNPGVVYASGGGVFKSTDGGDHWSPSGLSDANTNDLAFDPWTSGTLYAGGDNQLYKTTDGGDHWASISNGLQAGGSLLAVAVDPITATTLYVGAWDGVLKSTDGGANWAPLNDGLDVRQVNALLIDPQDPAILYAGTSGGGVYVIEQQAVTDTVRVHLPMILRSPGNGAGH